MTPYVPVPMYATYLHELTLKELKAMNSKLIKEPPKEDKEEEQIEPQAPLSLNGHSTKIVSDLDCKDIEKQENEEFLPPQ